MKLTPAQERAVRAVIVTGSTIRAGEILGIAESTVRSHTQAACQKLHADNLIQMTIKYLVRNDHLNEPDWFHLYKE